MNTNNFFSDDKVDLEILRKRAYSMRWAVLDKDVIPFSSADPDFMPAPEITNAMIEYIKGGYMSYTPSTGMIGLRESISEGIMKRKNEKSKPELIIPTDSAARGMKNIADSLLEKGDEAIVFDPVDLLFAISVRKAGATPVFYECSRTTDEDWDFSDLEELITPKTKMICFCNPHNPLGLLYSRKALQQILDIANKHNLYIMNDEVWSDIIYKDATFNSLLSFPEDEIKNVLTVYGYSKGFGIPGLRAGFIVCQTQELFDKIFVISGSDATIGGVASVTQVAMMACFNESYYWVDEYIKHLQNNRDYVYKRLSAMPGIKPTKQEATFVSFFDITETGVESDDFAKKILEEQKVFLVPGNKKWFGPSAYGKVRLCYATSHAILKEGLDRIEQGVLNITK